MGPAVAPRRITTEEFVASIPEKLELVGGEIPGGEDLLLLLLTQFGLARVTDMVGHELWRSALSRAQTQVGAAPPRPDEEPVRMQGHAPRARESLLLANLARRRERLRQALESASSHWGFEDPIYRFYHQSFKVYALQQQTEAIVRELEALLPGTRLDPWFAAIVSRGTGKTFDPSHNRNWTEVTGPMLEAFFHARFFLEMAVRYAHLDAPPDPLPSGYAALLCLYRLR